MTRRAGWLAAWLATVAGCGPTPIDTTYGRSRGSSINGTGAFAQLLRDRGHEVRSAIRLNETLADWAGVLVRFSPHPGPPDAAEGRWMLDWLQAGPGRGIVYVARDFDAGPEFWTSVIAAQPRDAPPRLIEELKSNLARSRTWPGELPPKPKTAAPERDWFATAPNPSPPATCTDLDGPWSSGVDAGAAALTRHEGIRVEDDEQPIPLRGDGVPLATSWTVDNGGRVLALANGSFLLNASLLNRARRPLTLRVVDWIGPGPVHVAFVEGASVLVKPAEGEPPASSPLHLFRVDPFGRVGAHVLAFLLILALAHAVRLGRPRPEPPSGVERPSAHPEALGDLLARTGRADAARELLEAYRRWRHPAAATSRAPSTTPTAPSPPSPRP